MTPFDNEPGSSRQSKSVSFDKNVKSPTTSVGNTSRRVPAHGSNLTGQRQPQKKTIAVNNIKKQNLVELIKRKKECEKIAHDIVLRLIDVNVQKEDLLASASMISKQHMDDIIEERRLSHICGWVLCDCEVDQNNIPKQKYRIQGQKVYDITERKMFCSGKCYAKSAHFKDQLLTSPLWLRDLEEDVKFEVLDDDNTQDLQGLTVRLTTVSLSDDEDECDDDNDKLAKLNDENNPSEHET